MLPNWNANQSTRTQICTLTQHLLFTYESKWSSKVFSFSAFLWTRWTVLKLTNWHLVEHLYFILSFSGILFVQVKLIKEWLSVKEASNKQLQNIWKRANKRKHTGKFRGLTRLVRNHLDRLLEACECVTPTNCPVMVCNLKAWGHTNKSFLSVFFARSSFNSLISKHLILGAIG